MGARTKTMLVKIWPASGSIRHRIFFLLGGMSLGALLVANLIWFPSVIKEIRQAQSEIRSVSVHLVRDQIQQYLERKETDLTSTALYFRPRLLEGDREGIRLIAQRFLQREPAFEEIGILDEKGKELIRLSRRLAITDGDLTDRSGSALFREGMKREVYWGAVTITETSEPWVALAVPLPGSNTLSGGLVFGVINLKSLWNLTREFKLSREGRVYIVEEMGRLIAAADPSLVLRQLSFADRPLIQRLVDPKNSDDRSFVEGDYANEKGVKVAATGLLLTRPRWGVVIDQPQSLLFAPIRQKIWLFAVLSFVGLLASFGLAHALSRRLTEPIIRLREGAEQVGGGNLEYRVPIETDDEIGELARQFNRMAEQLRISQQATLSALTIPVMSQTSELQGVLDEVAVKVMNLTGAEAASLRLVDDESRQFTLSVYRGFSEAYTHERPAMVREEAGGAKILETGEALILEDLLGDSGGARDPLVKEGFRSVVYLPLKILKKNFGIMTLASREQGRLSSKQADLFTAIAHQISVALQNVSLFHETKRNLEGIRALHEIGKAITSTLDLHDILAVLLEKIDLFLPYSTATVRLLNKDSGLLEPVACRNLDEKEWKSEKWRGGRGTPNVAFESKAPVMVSNVQTDPRVKDPEFFRKHGLVSYLGVPLIAQTEVLGVLSFYTKEEHEFTGEEVEFLTTLAGQAAIAIHNSAVYEELAKLANDLTRSNRVKDEFLSVMSHELRTPLNVVMGYTGMIRDRLLGEINSEQEKALEKVISRARDQLTMISSILQATQLEAEGVRAQSREVSMKDFLDDLKSGYSIPLGKDLNLIWDCPVDLPVINTDSEKLKSILQNLVNNAIKFTDRGTVTISASVKEATGGRQQAIDGQDGTGSGQGSFVLTPSASSLTPSWVEFKVADTGVGIAKDNFSMIFERFRQVDSSETRKYGGVGIGLYIVKKFTELLGGKVSLESELGKGSTFTVTIPRSIHQQAGKEEAREMSSS